MTEDSMEMLLKRAVNFRRKDYENNKDLFNKLKEQQTPHTLFISCSDSRVDPNMITGSLPGELFTIRNIANIVPPFRESNNYVSTASAIEYAVLMLGVDNIIVCGHSDCGGCAAYLKPEEYLDEFPHTKKWLNLSHKIRDRDDVANLQRMYYHIFKNVLSKRWPDKSSWILYPDQNTAIDWDTIEDILDIKSSNIEAYSNLFTKGRFKFRLKEEFNIREIVPCGSKYEPLIQLGDLYAGMAIYSRDSYNMYCHLSQTYFATVKQLSLFDVEIDNSIKPSRADKERCRLIFEFNKLCKSKKLGVSLDTYRGLRTRDPSNPINFWWYEPQHELDKAPLKQKY
jgi:carbonic anhydrase